MQHRGWTLTQEWMGPFLMWQGIDLARHDESGNWQIVAGDRESLIEEIDERLD